LKITIRLTKEKKIYFSAYQTDEEKFAVSIRDGYSSVSGYLMDILKHYFQILNLEMERISAYQG